jgi:hypothetical protein
LQQSALGFCFSRRIMYRKSELLYELLGQEVGYR